MPRPVQWSRDLHSIRERAARARTETWSRLDIERLFAVSRASAQNLMKAIGEVRAVGTAHFGDRASLLRFLEELSLNNGLVPRMAFAYIPLKRPTNA